MSVSKIKPKTTKRFTDFNLDDQIIQAINELGWEYPTRVQEGMIPIAMEGKNIIARARTGSGKTAAFVLPLLNQLIQWASSDAEEGPFALIVAPTKELATQIFQLLSQMATRFVFLQLVNLAEKEAANMERVLSTTVDVIVTTPGKIVEVLKQKPDLLQRIKYMVLDEADLLFSYGYKDELLKLRKHLPKKYQAIMTSATLDEDMTEIKQMFASGTIVSLKLKEGQLPNPEQLTQYQVYCNNDEERFTLVLSLLKLKLLVGKTIFFVSSIDRCYKLHLFLQGFKIRSCVLNSQMPANTRSHVINEFNLDKFKYIIASDARDTVGDDDQEVETSKKGKKKKKPRISHDRESGVSRGIDFHFVSNVINFDFPTSTDLYIHRVGRTARGFNRGTALSFVGPHERETFEMVKDDINAQLGEDTIAPYEVRMADFDGFFLRTREVLSAITRTVIRETRLTEIKRELLASKRLDGYFSKNPREKAALQNDKRLPGLKLHSTGIADVADYMVPKALRGRYYKSGEDQASSAMSNNRKRRPARRSIFGQGRNKKAKRGNTNDPLRSFTI
jgi:ATP-dependent RNA helicase DDX56/DBP9